MSFTARRSPNFDFPLNSTVVGRTISSPHARTRARMHAHARMDAHMHAPCRHAGKPAGNDIFGRPGHRASDTKRSRDTIASRARVVLARASREQIAVAYDRV
jgi:hypothetical protein